MNTNKILVAICLLASMLSFSGCKDDMLEEITTINLDRVLSPTDLNARIVNKTNIRLEWKAVSNADSYVVEVYDNPEFSGSAVKAISDIAFSQLPYTVTGLAGETAYSVRVKAIGENIADSKWVTASITTDAEQIFLPVNLEKLGATSVTLNWPAGEIATSITIAPGNITHTVTAGEVAAGEATISGLTGETSYTAKLINGTKVRGTTTFTTTLDLGGAIAVSPTDNLATLAANAVGGEVFALLPGTYTINTDIFINKSISIKGARPTDRPIIKGMTLRVKANAGLSLKDLILDGTGSNTNQTILYDEALDNAYGALDIQGCEIKNYVKGLIYVNLKTLIESVTISGNTIYNIECNGGDFIDFRNGLTKVLLFENNTVYNSALARDLFRMDPNGSTNFPGVTSTITIRTNTFNNVANGASRRFLYIRLASHQIHFTKNLIANTAGYYTNQTSTTITTMANNNYFNAPNFTASATSGAKNDTPANSTSLDPGFKDASSGDFTVGNEDLKLNGIGAPKWR